MRLTVTPAEMKRVETRVMNETAVTGDMLMQRAAAHVAAAVRGRAKAAWYGACAPRATTRATGWRRCACWPVADDAFAGEVWLMEGALSPGRAARAGTPGGVRGRRARKNTQA